MKCQICKKEIQIGRRVHVTKDNNFRAVVCSVECAKQYDETKRQQGDIDPVWDTMLFKLMEIEINGCKLDKVVVVTKDEKATVQMICTLPGRFSIDSLKAFAGKGTTVRMSACGIVDLPAVPED